MTIVSDKPTKNYAISELAEEFAVTSRALRLYEESGMLTPQREGTRRIYNERDRVRLRLILRGKRLGCSLSEIKELLDLYGSSSGEKAQLLTLLDRLDRRRKVLKIQQQDVEHALKDLEDVAANARKALEKFNQLEKSS